MNDTPIYISKRAGRNLWQEYRIYRDRLELPCRPALYTFVVPANEILEIEVRPPVPVFDLFRGGCFPSAFAFKLDNPDFCRHVALRRKSGFFKHLRFSPDDPDKFVAVCKSILPDGGTTA